MQRRRVEDRDPAQSIPKARNDACSRSWTAAFRSVRSYRAGTCQRARSIVISEKATTGETSPRRPRRTPAGSRSTARAVERRASRGSARQTVSQGAARTIERRHDRDQDDVLEHVHRQRLVGIAVERRAEREVEQDERDREQRRPPPELRAPPAGCEPLSQPERVEDDARRGRRIESRLGSRSQPTRVTGGVPGARRSPTSRARRRGTRAGSRASSPFPASTSITSPRRAG